MGKGGVAVAAQKKRDESYTVAEPAAGGSLKRPKFRPQPPGEGHDEFGNYPANIMFDRRVIRGNTYAAQILPAAVPLETQSLRRTGGRGVRLKPPSTPEPVEGRRHMDIQTDAYLEELTDTVPEAEVTTQTDAFMDRPPTPLFIPMKIGVDVETQIASGDLFDFAFEVEPILEVLVGKTLEQGLMEVMEEEELAAMRAHQEHFEQIRNAELVATQRMEASERRKMEEKDRRLAQERERTEREKTVREKIAAQTFARGYLSGLVGSVFDRLYDSGFFYDPVQKEVEMEFMPWLADAVVAECSTAAVSRRCVNDIIIKAIKDGIVAKADGAARAKKEVVEAAAAKTAAKAAVKAAELSAAERAKTELALKVLTELDPPLITEEQLAEGKAALMPAPEEVPEPEEGEEPVEPEPIPEPTPEALLTHFLNTGAVTEEQVAKAIADRSPTPPEAVEE